MWNIYIYTILPCNTLIMNTVIVSTTYLYALLLCVTEEKCAVWYKRPFMLHFRSWNFKVAHTNGFKPLNGVSVHKFTTLLPRLLLKFLLFSE